MKGVVQQMRESKVTKLGEFTKEDLNDLLTTLENISKDEMEYRRVRVKEMEDNRKAIFKRSKELNKEIPIELAYHTYLNFGKTYVGSEFVEKYKEWWD